MPRLEDVLADLVALPGAHAAALAGLDGLLVDAARAPDGAHVDLDGAVVELTHAWQALGRASSEHLAGGPLRTASLASERGAAWIAAVGTQWFAVLWGAPDLEAAAANGALERAVAALAEVVA